MSVVVDASAVLAFLGNEPGAEALAIHLPGAAMSAVNLAEVASKLSDRGMDSEAIGHVVDRLGLRIIAFDADAALAAATLRGPTRRAGLSLGDRACLALGKARGVATVTADRAWMRLDLGVEVILIR